VKMLWLSKILGMTYNLRWREYYTTPADRRVCELSNFSKKKNRVRVSTRTGTMHVEAASDDWNHQVDATRNLSGSLRRIKSNQIKRWRNTQETSSSGFEFRLGLTSPKNPKIFKIFLSHRIFRCMHWVLNINKNKN